MSHNSNSFDFSVAIGAVISYSYILYAFRNGIQKYCFVLSFAPEMSAFQGITKVLVQNMFNK